MEQGRLHIVLVCHMEADFEGGWEIFEKYQPMIEKMIQRVADATGKQLKMTYCVTGEFIEDKIECVWSWIDQGHEIWCPFSHLGQSQARSFLQASL